MAIPIADITGILCTTIKYDIINPNAEHAIGVNSFL